MRVYLLFLVGYGGYALQTRAPIQAMTISGTPPRWSHPSQLLAHPTPHPKCMNCLSPIFPTNENQYTLLQRAGTHCYGADLTFPFTQSDRLGTAHGFTVHDNACLECSRIIYIICVYIYIERESPVTSTPSWRIFSITIPNVEATGHMLSLSSKPKSFWASSGSRNSHAASLGLDPWRTVIFETYVAAIGATGCKYDTVINALCFPRLSDEARQNSLSLSYPSTGFNYINDYWSGPQSLPQMGHKLQTM